MYGISYVISQCFLGEKNKTTSMWDPLLLITIYHHCYCTSSTFTFHQSQFYSNLNQSTDYSNTVSIAYYFNYFLKNVLISKTVKTYAKHCLKLTSKLKQSKTMNRNVLKHNFITAKFCHFVHLLPKRASDSGLLHQINV